MENHLYVFVDYKGAGQLEFSLLRLKYNSSLYIQIFKTIVYIFKLSKP